MRSHFRSPENFTYLRDDFLDVPPIHVNDINIDLARQVIAALE